MVGFFLLPKAVLRSSKRAGKKGRGWRGGINKRKSEHRNGWQDVGASSGKKAVGVRFGKGGRTYQEIRVVSLLRPRGGPWRLNL